MNFRIIITLISLFYSGHLLADGVMLQVKVMDENGSIDHKTQERTRSHWLVVRITNSSGTKLEGLTLRWKLYAANLQRGADEIIVEKAGDVKFSVDASGQFTDLTTQKVPFTYAPMHSEKSGTSRRARFKKVDESGVRYHGYLVQVLNGETVIGQSVSNQALLKVQ